MSALLLTPTAAPATVVESSARGSSFLSATYIIGGAMVSIANVTQIREDGSLTCGLAGVAIGITGLVYCNQAPAVRDEGAIRITSTAALITGALSIGRRIRVVREQKRRRVSLLLDPASGGRAGVRIIW